MHNDIILPFFQGGFYGDRNEYDRVCIGYMSLRKYMPKHIKLKSNTDKTIFVCETCISAMLLQSGLNKWRLSQLSELENLYITTSPTRLLKISKKY